MFNQLTVTVPGCMETLVEGMVEQTCNIDYVTYTDMPGELFTFSWLVFLNRSELPH